MTAQAQFNHIAVGGTFDHLHAGHQSLLCYAIDHTDKLTLGLTTDDYVKSKRFHTAIQPYELRKEQVAKFIQTYKPKLELEIVPLSDIYGPAAVEQSMDAIVVTKESGQNALKINLKRKQNHLKPLKLLHFELKKGDDRKIIRSQRIREGEIDQQGRREVARFMQKASLHLPQPLRNELRNVFGQIVPAESTLEKTALSVKKILTSTPPTLIITVGDIVYSSLISQNLTPDLAIIDHKNERENLKKPASLPHQYRNLAGSIVRNPVVAINRAYKRILKNKTKEIIYILGEEDLLALPAILLAPLGSVVIYGMRNQGIVLVKVDQTKKLQIAALVERFE
ncbi:MAG: pantetheine-phosphate adenylyltransferase [Weeksellaceae bacterium]